MRKIGVSLPSMTDLSEVPLHRRFIKDILANRERVEEVMVLYEPPSTAPLEPKLILKLSDPGKFTIPCSLGDLKLEDALCDSGASVNVISLEMVKRLGIKDLKPHSSSLMFGDASSKDPLGLIEDYPLKIGNCLVPTDFMVVEMVQTRKVPLILGTPFLNTAGATIDFSNKRVVLKHVDDKIFYPIKPSSTILCGTIANEDMRKKGSCKEFGSESEEVQGISDDGHLDLLFNEPNHTPTLLNGEAVFPKGAKKESHEHYIPTMTLHPLRHVDGAIVYKVKCKGNSRPFASVKAILHPDMNKIDHDNLHELLSTVLTINLASGTRLEYFNNAHSTSSPMPRNPLIPPPPNLPKVHD